MQLADLLSRHAVTGRIEFIGLRPARLDPVIEVQTVHAEPRGLAGDHHDSGGKRALTLIQAEHLPLIAAFAGRERVEPGDLRRNLVVSRINLAALRNRTVRIGTALVRVHGPCAPCSRMERVLGHGGYNAMRGHGGFYAEVEQAGTIALGDDVVPQAMSSPGR